MIVDDDEDDIDFFFDAINGINPTYTCIAAGNGEIALHKLQNNSVEELPDFIFLDLNMPRMDGKTCLGELKKDHKLKDIPVIIYTTSDNQLDKDETLKLGAAHFLTKANTFNMLQANIKDTLMLVSSKTKKG